MKKIIALLLTSIMLLTMMPMSTIAAELNSAKIVVEAANTAIAGSQFNVDIKLENNPGIVSANINVAFDKGLTLVGASNGNVFPSHMSFIPPRQLSTIGKISGNCNFAWSGTDIRDDEIKDGIILTLTFETSVDAHVDDVYNITVSSNKSDVVDRNLQAVPLSPASASVTITDYTPGDVDGDGVITMTDTVKISRYIVDGLKNDPNGYGIELDENAADVNDDDSISMIDIVMISRYIVDNCKTVPEPEGYGIILKHKTKKCIHSLEKIEAVEATCENDGRIAYWHCTKCGKNYANENGTNVVSEADIIVVAKGHTWVVDPYVPPTETTPGWTEGSHCGICGEIRVSPEPIPVIKAKTYNIVYHLWDNDTDYLKGLNLDNSGNPTSKDCTKTLRLNPVPDEGIGFNFLYWYQKGENKATTTIEANTMEEGATIHLYAKWEKVSYSVQFDSDLVPVEPEVYNVDEAKVLPTPTLDGYDFVGWSDEEGNVIRRIPQGEPGKKIYTANWMSKRNQALTKKTLDDPIIYEDEENKQIIFSYEVGEIKNVPVQVVHDFGYINSSGITKSITKEFSKKVSTTEMKSYAKTASKATTESFGWALSDGWSDQITVNSEWCKENGISEEQAKEICTNDTEGWYVSNGSSGYDTKTTYGSTDTHDLESTTHNTKTYGNKTTEKRQDFSAELDLSARESFKVKKLAEFELQQELDLKYSSGSTTKEQEGQDNDEGGGTDTGTITKTGADNVHNDSWNSESGTNASHSVTETDSVRRAVTEKTSEKTGYGKSYIKTGNEESSESVSNQASSSDSYGGSVTFSTEETEKETLSFTTENTVSGYHRWVIASTAHVFAGVCYDIKTSSYYVINYTIMDDKTYDYEDYSYKDPSYRDNENSVMTFDVPNDIEAYVNERVLGSDGLEVSRAGTVTNYSGKDDFVIIPEYKVINGPTGLSAVKVTGISSSAFANRSDIVAIELSDFIHEIPDGAFENCSELQHITAKEFSKIGSNAFDGCSKLTYASVGENVTEIGDNAFGCVKDLTVHASKKDVVEKALSSGAENILIKISEKCTDLKNLTLKVPSTIKTFVFDGSSKVFEDVVIDSSAGETTIRNAEFVSTGFIPIKISSPIVSFQEIKVGAPGVAVALTAAEAKVSLFGETYIMSANENAMICKHVELEKLGNGLYAQLHVTGNVLVCGEKSDVVDNKYLDIQDGEIIPITVNEFENYLKGTVKVTLNANGGTSDVTEINACFGTKIGQLPIPVKDYYNFDGWYTEDGTRFDESTVVESATGIELYARWVDKEVYGWIKASELPDDAQVVDRKWTYTLREYTTGGSSSLSGWTKYDTKRTSWGSTQGPVYSDPSNGSRNVWSESYISGYGSTYYWHFYKYGYSALDYSYSGASGGRTYFDVKLDYYPSNSSQRPVSKDGGSFKWYAEGTSKWAAVYYASEGNETDYNKPIYATRWYYQEPVYTYYYYRDLSKESTSDPTGQDNVSNVQKWVQYREK